MPTLEPPPARG